jgi:predicted  nucleic acid-binding Zn-ribbon protein
MEVITRNDMIECDACGNGITIAIKFLNKLYEGEDVVICNHCITNGIELISPESNDISSI